ncbi:MAG: hypothetical protein H6R19_1929 [Proteobacteria bacterium]|nr:hypothetical protein [Pseudomonadota bacterium]
MPGIPANYPESIVQENHTEVVTIGAGRAGLYALRETTDVGVTVQLMY